MAQHAPSAGGEPVNLLALDGGGIRGVSELLILHEIMRRVQYDMNLPEMPRPCDYFDLIGGTSTGGLIAIMLGRLRMRTDEALRTYNSLSRVIFSRTNKKWMGQDGAFKATLLKKKVQEIVLEKGLGELMLDPSNDSRKGKSFVCAVPANSMAHIRRFRTYHVRTLASANCRIWEAARATTAAPTFFKRIAIGEEGQAKEEFIDGALGCNNPATQVLEEARDIFGNDRPVRCLISIGTGHPGTISLAKPDAFQKILPTNLIAVLKRIATSSEDTANELSARFKDLEKFYFRFNVTHGAEGISLEEWEKMGELTEHTKAYMAEVSVSKAIDEVVDILCNQRESRVTLGNVCGVSLIRNEPKACWNVPFARNPRFVGRHTQLDQLEHAISTKDQPSKVAIFGLGGMGKTQIALELAYRTKEEHQDCSIFWMPATNTESLQQAFIDIGRQLRVLGMEKEQAKAKELVKHYLSQDISGQWLLVVDNIDDMEIWNNELKGWLPSSQRGYIVCTTRNRKVAVEIVAANVIEVLEMDGEVAMELLSKSLIDQKLLSHHQDAQKLLEQLTFLPLAIVQATAYINKNGITFLDYLSLLEEQEQDVVELLSEDFEDDCRYQDVKNPVATTWLISFEQIQRLDPLAADYLSFMSCVAPKDIPQSLLPPGPSRKKETDATGTLNAYSFVSRRPANDALDIHRLVQLATRSWLKAQGQWDVWTDKALARLVEVVPPGGHDKKDVWITYLPHAIHVISMTELLVAEGTLLLLDRIGRCEQTLGRYKAAEWAHRQLLKRREKMLAKDHPYMLSTMNNIARALSDQGKYTEAEHILQETLALRGELLGKEHPDTLASMNNLADVLGKQGKYTEAEHINQETLALAKKVFGKDNPNTLICMNNLAEALSHQEKYAEAEHMHQESLALKEKVLGRGHPDTLISINNLATTLRYQGKYAEAEKMHREMLALGEKVLGKEHPNMLMSMTNLADALSHQDKFVEAEQMLQETLALREKVLGKEHPDTLTSINNLALVLSHLGKFAETEQMHREMLALGKKVLGKEHPYTLTSMHNLAWVLSHQKKFSEAISVMEQCFHMQNQVFGPQHHRTMASIRALNKWKRKKYRSMLYSCALLVLVFYLEFLSFRFLLSRVITPIIYDITRVFK